MPAVPPQQQRARVLNKLHMAAMDGSVERTLSLLSNGSIDIDEGSSPEGWTPLMLASIKGHAPVVRVLLSKGADVSKVDNARHPLTALCTAAGRGHVTVAKMLMEAGAAVDSGGLTPLRLAAEEGHPEVMRVLIEAGANVNRREVDGESLLFTAAYHGFAGAARELLHAKADPLVSVQNSAGGEWFLPLEIAAYNGHSEVVRELLRQVGIEGCGGPSHGYHALCSAAQEQHVEMMAILMDAGVADTGAILTSAAGDGLEAPVKLLIREQAGKFSGGRLGYLNYRNDYGATPLLSSIFFCNSRSPRMVQLLVDCGADTTSAIRIKSEPKRKFVSGVRPNSARQGGCYFNDTPLALTTCLLRDKKIRGEDATKEQLDTLEAIRRLLLRVEAIFAVSWLWPRNILAIADTAKDSNTAETALTTLVEPPRMRCPVLRRRTRRGVLLAALCRHSSKP
ncbi:unnamed protein product [Pylaiella littoralis]